jgi:hypothetical protein
MLQIMNMKPVFVSIGLSLALCVACGGSDGGNGNAGGSSSASGGSSSTSGGSGNPGGSGNASAGASSSAGGTASTTTGSFTSGLPADKQLTALTDAEKASVCQKLSAYFSSPAVSKSFEEFLCRAESAAFALFSNPQTDAALQAACKPLYDQCIAAPVMTSESCDVQQVSSTCTATVAEYDACMNDFAKGLDQVLAAIPSCDKLTLASASQSPSGPSTPASCQTLQAKCPDVSVPGASSGM